LLNGVWGHDVYIEDRTVDVHIGRLRKALSDSGERDPIRTVRGSGYAFDERYQKGFDARMSAAINRLWDNRWAIATAAIVTFAFVLFGGLPLVLASVGFVAVCVVMLIAKAPASLPSSNPFPQPAAFEADWQWLQVIIDALPDPVVALDSTGAVLALNAQARRMPPALRQGEPISLGLRMPALIAAVRRAVATGAPQRVEFSERSRSEQWYEVHVIPAALSRPAGSPPDLLLTFHDLTQPRRIEQMRADFVANASHELRTPLAALSGFIETVRGPAQNDAGA